MKKIKLHWQIIICMIAGTFIGSFFNTYGHSDSNIYTFIVLLGDVFIRLLKMMIVPLIFSSIIIGVSSIKDRSKIGRLGFKTFSYYVCTSLIAILIGLFLANTIEPGIGASTIDNAKSFDTTTLSSSTSILDIIKRMIPTNPISSLASGDMLGIIFFAIFFGIVLSFTEKKYSATILSLIQSIYQVVMKMTQAIITLAPIGVLGLMTKAVSNSGLSIFKEF